MNIRHLVCAIGLLLVVATTRSADDPAERPAALDPVNADRAAHELARCPSAGR